MDNNIWEFWIDVGGTFTDCLAKDPSNHIKTFKLLSSSVFKIEGQLNGNRLEFIGPSFPCNYFQNFKATAYSEKLDQKQSVIVANSDKNTIVFDQAPFKDQCKVSLSLESPDESPIAAIRWFLGLGQNETIPKVTLKMGTTIGTNALLEHQGAKTAFITTKGFKDILEIRQQNRPRLFDLNIKKSQPLYLKAEEIGGRIDAKGHELIPFDTVECTKILKKLKSSGISSVAISFMNSFLNPAHEKTAETLAHQMGFENISVSYKICSQQKFVPRSDTTLVDAYLTPKIQAYISGILQKIPQSTVQLMSSAGGLIDSKEYSGKDCILSGPAGGVIGVANICKDLAIDDAIGFDMGGTSTDVCKYDGTLICDQSYILNTLDHNGIPLGMNLAIPAIPIETVASGGGSICWFDGQKLRVGPHSAGAVPGPACYGGNGPLTITDCNLLMGKLAPTMFPFPLNLDLAQQRLLEIAALLGQSTSENRSPEEIVEGFLKIAAENMSAPIKKISIAKGHDVKGSTLISFGGAGAQHACDIAETLGIKRIIQHPYSSILSAYGIGTADIKKQSSVSLNLHLDTEPSNSKAIENEICRNVAALIKELKPNHIANRGNKAVAFYTTIEMRYQGQDSVLLIPFEDCLNQCLTEFAAKHHQTFGYTIDGGYEFRNLHVEMVTKLPKYPLPQNPAHIHQPKAHSQRVLKFALGPVEANEYLAKELQPGAQLKGPAVIVDHQTSVFVSANWQANILPNRCVELLQVQGQAPYQSQELTRDAIQLSLFNGRFMSIAEQMGETLQRTSMSVNVKERLDFSCAIFTAQGDLVVNAPHIPVHLGAMGDTVKSFIKQNKNIRPSQVFVSNNPAQGGSHLPDVTVVSPVFNNQGKIVFFTGNRAHHSEIGGITPGSMPPHSKYLDEEGVLIDGFIFDLEDSQSEARLRKILLEAPYPTRSVNENLADLKAQIASNKLGERLLLDLCNQFGQQRVEFYREYMRTAAAEELRKALLKIKPGTYSFCDAMDNGCLIKVKITIHHDGPNTNAVVDFTGSAAIDSGNLNANSSIVKAAVLYVFRCLIDEDIPLNDGVLTPLEIIIPEPSILSPLVAERDRKPATVGGNVETSTRIVDVLLGALTIAAASQGTMNNFIFGKKASATGSGFGYYETICGGSGAGPGFHGTSAVHTHMTNTRITDPEILEERFPLILNEFSIRKNSGGKGKFLGGDGAIREFTFLEPLTVSLLTQRRKIPPFGLEGGQCAMPGRNLYKAKINQGIEGFQELAEMAQLEVMAGDVLRIETPGGGGYGTSDSHQ